jgi:hypothetical protein
MPGHLGKQTSPTSKQDSLAEQATEAVESPRESATLGRNEASYRLWALAGDERSRNGMIEWSLFHLSVDSMNTCDDTPVESSSAS